MSRLKINSVVVIVAALFIGLSVVGCNQYISGAKVRLQENPPNYEAAINTLTEGLEYAPKDAEMHALLAFCYIQTKQYKSANKAYTSAIEYSPTQKDSLQKAWDDNWNDLYNLAGSSLKKSVSGPKDSAAAYLEKAQSQINDAIDLAPMKAENYIRKGFIYRLTGKNKESDEMFAKAVSIDPSNPDAYYQIGRAAMEASNWDDAIKNLSKAVELNKENHLAVYWLGVAQLQKRDFPSAQKSFRMATNLKPDEKDAWFNLAQAYYFEGTDIRSAIDALDKVIVIDAKDIEALSLLGSAALHKDINDYDRAIDAYTRILEIKPDSEEYKNYLDYAKKQKEATQKPAVTKKKKKTN